MTDGLNERDARFLARAFSELAINDDTCKMIADTHREVEFDISLELTGGVLASYRGYRIQHDRNLGPFKGGLRYHPEVSRSHLRELAAAMTWKTALHDLPLGGAKGGVDCDPRQLDKRDLREITRRYVDRVGQMIGPELDIPAPDMGTDEETMAWLYDAYGRQHGDRPGVVTGKPLALHGTYGRTAATGYGVALATALAARRERIDLEGARVAIQGFGNVGSFAARKLREQGARIVAVTDSRSGVYDAGGLDVDRLKNRRHEARQAGERLALEDAARGGDRLGVNEVLAVDVDVLIPAAIEYVVDADNAADVSAAVVVEGANLPLTADASEALEDRGIRVIPDIMANAGGVIVSYLEWVQNRQGLRWSAEDVEKAMERRMRQSWEILCDAAASQGSDYRQAGFNIAVERINTAISYRGV